MIISLTMQAIAERNPPAHYQNFIPLQGLLARQLGSKPETMHAGMRAIKATLRDKLGPEAIGDCLNRDEASMGEIVVDGRKVTALRSDVALYPFDMEGRWYAARWWLAFQNADVDVVLQAIRDVVGPLKEAA